ncbi:Helicase associated domain protein [Kitasatospora purpeofusca]|uniref:DEAD/DEAH box helicase n=1 Tax=Kitasatospora purpeofusca TaxID=67352 RepID=UPI0035DE1905
MKINLRPHQEEAADASVTALREHTRCVLHMACGTGKTLTAGEVANRLVSPAERRVAIGVPSLDLVTQTMKQWHHAWGRELGALAAVCTDPKVLARLEADGVPAYLTTDPAQLAAFIRDNPRATVAYTYQSMDKLHAAHTLHRMPDWNLNVLDEAHRTVGSRNTWRRVHDNAYLPSRNRLSMTATLRIIAGDDNDDVISLDRPDKVGPIAYTLGFGEAIDRDLLADYRVVIATVTEREISDLTGAPPGQQVFLSIGRSHVEASVFAKAVAVLRAAAQYGCRRMVTYHASVAAARAFSHVLHQAMDHLPPDQRPRALWTEHLNGSHDASVRGAVLEQLRAGIDGLAVVTNARLLTEGVDMPEVDSVALVDTRSSPTDLIQIGGRPLRGRAPKIATVLVPTIGNGSNEYAEVINTLLAMAALDSRLAGELDTARRRLHADGKSTLPDWISFSGVDVPSAFVHSISVAALHATATRTQRHLDALAAFRQEFGHLQVPRGWGKDKNLPSGEWLSTRREWYRKGILASSVSEALEQLGVVWNRSDTVWDEFLADIKAYRDSTGHFMMPARQRSLDGKRPLEARLQNYRQQADRLPADHLRALKDIGFDLDHHTYRRLHFAEILKEFVADTGRTRMPSKYHSRRCGCPAGRWLHEWKKAAAAGVLPPSWRREITSLGMELPAPPNTSLSIPCPAAENPTARTQQQRCD